MTRVEIKTRARAQIKGNIGMLFVISLVVGLITGIFQIPSTINQINTINEQPTNPAMTAFAPIASIALVILGAAFALSMAYIYKKLSQSEPISVSDAFFGFKDLGRAVITSLLMSLYLVLWFFCFIIPAIIKSYSYSMTYYILLDNPQMTAKQAITESRRIMDGNKFRLFGLQLSFLGWILLSILTFGILLIWIAPYIEASTYNFYLDVSGKLNEPVITPVEEAPIQA